MGKLRQSPMTGYPGQTITVEICKKRVRVLYHGEIIADSCRTLILNETAYRPVFYFPREDVRIELLQPSEHSSHCPFKGDAVYWTLESSESIAENAVWSYESPYQEMIKIKGYLAFDSARTDHLSMDISHIKQGNITGEKLYQEIKNE